MIEQTETNIRLFIDELEFTKGPYPHELATELSELADRVAQATTETEVRELTKGAFISAPLT